MEVAAKAFTVMRKVAKNTLGNLLYSRLIDLMNGDLGYISPDRNTLDEAVFITEFMREVKSGKKRIIVEVDTSNNGYGK